MKSAKIPPSPDMIATTERLLSDAFGGIIRLVADDDLTASGRTGVYRLRVLGGPDNVPVHIGFSNHIPGFHSQKCLRVIVCLLPRRIGSVF